MKTFYRVHRKVHIPGMGEFQPGTYLSDAQAQELRTHKPPLEEYVRLLIIHATHEHPANYVPEAPATLALKPQTKKGKVAK